MKFFLILSLISIVNSAHGFEVNNLKNVLKSLINVEPKVEQSAKNCCDPTAEELELINQCAIDLCGNSGTVESSYISNEDYENFYRNEEIIKDYTEFRPKLKKYLDIVRENTRNEVEAIKIKTQASNSSYYNLDSYTDEQISGIMSDELSSDIQVEILKDRGGNKKVSVTTLPSDVPFDEELKNKYIEFKTEQIKTNFSNGVYSGYLSLDEAMIFVQDAIEKHLEYVQKKIDESSDDEINLKSRKEQKEKYLEIKNQIIDTYSLTKENVTDFYYKIQSVDYLAARDLNLAYYNVPYKEFSCENLKCREYLSKKIPSMLSLKNMEEIIKQTKDDRKADELVSSCEYYWHEEKLKKAKPGKKQEFIDSIPDVLKKVKSNFTSKFSQESSASLDRYFDSLKFVIADDPIPGRDYFNYVEYLKENVLGVVRPKTEEDDSENSEDELKGVLADYRKFKNHFMTGEAKLEHELTICEEADNTANDHFNPSEYDSDSYIHSSSYSCNHYTTGKKVFAHELGHAISGQFLYHKTSKSSYSKYKGHRDCVSSHYKDKEFAETPKWKDFSHDGDTKYSEEDMADFVASIVYSNPNEGLLGCALLKKDKNNIDYDKAELSILNPISYDTHSTPFLRTLIEAISKNRVLTQSCQKIIDKYKDRINFNKCEY